MGGHGDEIKAIYAATLLEAEAIFLLASFCLVNGRCN